MKYLIVLLAVITISLALYAPNQLDLFPDRPYHGVYAEGK